MKCPPEAPAGDLARTTDTEGEHTVFDYDSSRRLAKITTPARPEPPHTSWSYDEIGNEAAGATNPEGTRTRGTGTGCSRMTSITAGGRTYAGQCGSTERIGLGDTFFHHGPLGLSAGSTAGVDTGFNREPGGTLKSMTREGKSHYCLTDALCSVVAPADETGAKANAHAYSPRGVRRATTSRTLPQSSRSAGG
ncbi:RHS repeat domain-containing protein [Streptomyces sp. NPDC051657]|uniref:RHS repeat domain-containing protein n=1 Tax=unclassified Streptomyces TaxID=2593676 RepID=UPI0034394950